MEHLWNEKKQTKGDQMNISDKAFTFNINKTQTFLEILVEFYQVTRRDKGVHKNLLMTTERTSDDKVLTIISSILLKPQ